MSDSDNSTETPPSHEKTEAYSETPDAYPPEKDAIVDIIADPEAREELIARFEAHAQREKIEISDQDVHVIVDCLERRTLDNAIIVLKDALEYHKDDPNFNLATYEKIGELVKGPELYNGPIEDYEFEVKLEAALIDDWSPYAEVRAVTQISDDPTESCETFRVYIIGLSFAVACNILNVFFFNRYPTINMPTMAMQLLVAPIGRFWAACLPDWGFSFRGSRYSLNPGPWTFKEQMLTTLCISVSAGAPYSAYVITSQKSELFYGFKWITFGYQFLLTLSSQFMGFGIAGLMRTFLVYPVKAMWFSVLPYLALNRALIKPEAKNRVDTTGLTPNQSRFQRALYFWRSAENVNGWTLTRNSFFWLFLVVAFVWYWFPEFLIECFSYFNWMTWISPNNVNLAAITGSLGGLGLNPISTFDWTVLNNGGLVTPFFASNNLIGGQLIGFFAVVIIWYTNVRWTSYLPINDNSLFDNTGNVYQVANVLNKDNLLDEAAYQKYGLPYYTAGNLVVYGAFFMLYPATIVYTILHYHRQIRSSIKHFWYALRNPTKALTQFNDPFTRAIKVHKEVPEWWFLIILVLSLVFSIVLVEHFPLTNTPVWTIFFAFAINIVFIVPFGLLYAITNISWDVNVLTELIVGYALPGNPNALMIVKCYATNFLSQTENYVTNQKQSHYARVPPRALFRVQLVSVLICCFASVGLINWQLDSIKGYCARDNPQKFTCAGSRTFFTASVLWGTIGPKRVFNGLYPAMKYCFLIGVFLPIPFYVAERFFKWARGMNVIVMIYGAITWAPYNFMYTLENWYFSIAFQYFIKRRYTGWWQKYNYLLYAGLTAGSSWSAFILFFATAYKHVVGIDWRGNSIPFEGVDAMGPIRLDIPEKGYFGVEPGHFP